jgi:hypothetical protein
MTDDDDTQVYRSELEAAVKAAIEAEREACAKVCDGLVLHQYSASGCAAAIRARGESNAS